MAICKFRYRRLKDDPHRFALVIPDDPKHWFKFEKVLRSELKGSKRDYHADSIEELIRQLGEFRYGDEKSVSMLKEMEQSVMRRDAVIVEDRAIYTG